MGMLYRQLLFCHYGLLSHLPTAYIHRPCWYFPEPRQNFHQCLPNMDSTDAIWRFCELFKYVNDDIEGRRRCLTITRRCCLHTKDASWQCRWASASNYCLILIFAYALKLPSVKKQFMLSTLGEWEWPNYTHWWACTDTVIACCPPLRCRCALFGLHAVPVLSAAQRNAVSHPMGVIEARTLPPASYVSY